MALPTGALVAFSILVLLGGGEGATEAEPPARALALFSSGEDRIRPLPGHPVLSTDTGKKVFAGGFQQHLTLAHTGTQPQTIDVRSIKIEVVSFDEQSRPELAYKIDGDALPIAGIAEPHLFRVSLKGEEVGRPAWVEENSASVLRAESEDLLDTRPKRLLRLKPGVDDVEDLVGTVLVQRPGLYEVRFRIRYSIGAREEESLTEPVTVYLHTAP